MLCARNVSSLKNKGVTGASGEESQNLKVKSMH